MIHCAWALESRCVLQVPSELGFLNWGCQHLFKCSNKGSFHSLDADGQVAMELHPCSAAWQGGSFHPAQSSSLALEDL